MSDATIEIVVNGQGRSVPAGASVADLLERLELDRGAVVVELNRRIVRRDELEAVDLAAGDRVELVRFVGGG